MAVPVILVLSLIPDVDLLFQRLQLEHRGPTHSVVMAFLVFVPIFAVYRKQAIPYFIALISHSLIGDYIVGGRIQLLWPLTTQYYGLPISIGSLTDVVLEWIVFILASIVMLKTGDLAWFLKPHKSNLILAVPVFAVLLPTVLSYPLNVPVSLLLPHVFYIILFMWSIAIALRSVLRK